MHLWNNLPKYIIDSPSNSILKSRFKTYYNNPVKPPKYFSFGSGLANIMHTRLWQNCSSLTGYLIRSITVIVTVTIMWKTMTTTSCTVHY